MARGAIINNPLDITETKVNVVFSSFSGSKPSTGGDGMFYANVYDDACSGVTPCPPPALLSEAIERAKVRVGTKVSAKLHSEQIQFLASVGEGRETLSMLRGAIRTLFSLKRSVLNYGRALVRAARSPKRLAKKLYLDAENAYMYIRMGWRPFFGEVENLHAAMTHLTEKRWKCRFIAKETIRLASRIETPAAYVNWLRARHEKSVSEEIQVSAGIIAEMKADGWPDTWGLTKIPQTIWELTTLSWCVDYFCNIGSLIAACTPDTYWRPLISWTTVHRVTEDIIRAKNITYADYGPSVPEGGHRRTVTKRITRRPGVSVGFALKPMLTWDNSSSEILDTLAVLRQKFSGICRQFIPIEKEYLDRRPRR